MKLRLMLSVLIKGFLKRRCHWFEVLLVGFLLLAPVGLKSSSENESDVFRVCVISHDMPLSNQDSDKSSGLRGLYIDLAEAMAKELGKSLEVHFTMVAFYKRPVRAGLLRRTYWVMKDYWFRGLRKIVDCLARLQKLSGLRRPGE